MYTRITARKKSWRQNLNRTRRNFFFFSILSLAVFSSKGLRALGSSIPIHEKHVHVFLEPDLPFPPHPYLSRVMKNMLQDASLLPSWSGGKAVPTPSHLPDPDSWSEHTPQGLALHFSTVQFLSNTKTSTTPMGRNNEWSAATNWPVARWQAQVAKVNTSQTCR